MAKKSKTQKAKASAARAARKEARVSSELEAESNQIEVTEVDAAERGKKRFGGFLKKEEAKVASEVKGAPKAEAAKAEKKQPAKPKKKRFQFLRDVRSEMKRVTWPTKQDVLRWSIVVVCALLFFGIYVAILDNAIVTPLLVGISGLAGLGA